MLSVSLVREAARSGYMHPATQWRRKYYLLSLFRLSRRVSDAFLAVLTACRLNGRLNGTRQSPPGDVYSEEAFRRLLESEAIRSERSGHFCQLLLVYRTNPQRAIVPMGDHISRMVIEALSGSLRVTDYIGWYRDEQIMGVLLTAMGRDSVAAGHNRLRLRLEEIFRARLAPEETCSVQIRAYRHDEITQAELPGPRDSRALLL